MRKFVASRGRAAAAVLTGAALVTGTVLVTAGTAFATTSTTVTVTGLSTNRGSDAGGTNVMLTGKGFTTWTPAAGDIKFNGTAATVTPIVLSDTQMAVVAPAQGTGTATGNVIVTDGGSATSATSTANAWTYLPPITAAVPTNTLLNSLGGSVVTVTASGTGVSLGASATAFAALKITGTVNGVAAPLKWLTASTVAMTVPAGTPSSTAVKVALLNNGVAGTADSANAKYAAVISKLSVTSGPVAGTNTVAVTGKGFTSSTVWKFGGVNVTGSCTLTSNTAASCVVPAASAAGAVSVNFTPASSAPYATTAAATYTYSDVS
jgi:hypothetical protein